MVQDVPFHRYIALNMVVLLVDSRQNCGEVQDTSTVLLVAGYEVIPEMGDGIPDQYVPFHASCRLPAAMQ